MSKERFGGSYLIMSNPIERKCFIGIYDAEGELHEIFNGPKSKPKDFSREKHIWGKFREYLKRKFNPYKDNEFEENIRELVGEHVFLVPVETREEYWSYKKALDEQSKGEEPEIFLKYKIHKFDEEHPFHMLETEDHSEIDEFDPFTKGEAREVINFVKKNIFKKPKK